MEGKSRKLLLDAAFPARLMRQASGAPINRRAWGRCLACSLTCSAVASFLSDPATITPAILAVDSRAAAAHVTQGPPRRRSTPCGLQPFCLTIG